MPRSGWLLHAEEESGSVPIAPGVSLATSPEALGAVAEASPGEARFLMGYAGWGAGQLEGEMAQGAWLTATISPELVFHTPADQLWDTALRSIGVEPSTLVAAPGVH